MEFKRHVIILLVSQGRVIIAELKATWTRTHQSSFESILVSAVHGATALHQAKYVKIDRRNVAHGQVGDDRLRLFVPIIGLYDDARCVGEVVVAVHNSCNIDDRTLRASSYMSSRLH